MESFSTRKRLAWFTAVTLVLLLVVYPLSVGPACVIAVYGPQGVDRVINRFYSPIDFVAEVTGTEWMVKKYVIWWLAVAGVDVPSQLPPPGPPQSTPPPTPIPKSN